MNPLIPILILVQYCCHVNSYGTFGDKPIRGVNLGGWLILEKWMRPSVFSNLPKEVNDEYKLCKHLNKTEAERRLRSNWDNWVTEKDILSYKNAGINHVRIPIGYWAINIQPGEPWISGSWDYAKKAVGWCKKHGIRVMITLHAAPGSQNGEDHSGRKGDVNFFYNQTNLERASKVVKEIAKWTNSTEWRETVSIIQVLNEPKLWGKDYHLRLKKLKEYYKMAYDGIREVNKEIVVAIHDAFIEAKNWYYLREDSHYKNVMLDTHLYQVFGDKYKNMTCEEHEKVACEYRDRLKEANKKLWTVVGEWSLATPKPCNNREILARQQVGVFEENSSGWFFWAHKNEQKWHSWSFQDSYEKGWLNPNTKYVAKC